MYIHELKNWPELSWNIEKLSAPLAQLRHNQGRLLGHMEALGFKLREEANLQTITLEILKSSEIEGQMLNEDQVRSSVARRLGIDVAGLATSDRNVEGVVEMMLDATQNFNTQLTEERLFGWHAALFPTGRSGMYKIIVGNWRNDSKGPMQVVSGPVGRERVHYEAPAAGKLGHEMSGFLEWFNQTSKIDPVLKAAVVHLWFVTIHPFDDGNGRIGRAIADMQLTRADGSSQRFYSMSAQIEREKKDYYDMLERTQKGTLDITGWIEWFLGCLDRSLLNAATLLEAVLRKAQFWERVSGIPLNERQHMMLNRLLDDFYGKLTTAKWAKLAKCSQDTALRDIQDLIEKNILAKDESGGRSTTYSLVLP
ncbi:MAG: Fic family protein [Sphingobacteriales bacterium]|nr:MAG: Fic family protein [Sphingobacteriales bacterium]